MSFEDSFMGFSIESWRKNEHFFACPVLALEEALVEKELSEKDIPEIDSLIEDLRTHESDLRVLRQEIERKLKPLKQELYTKEHEL